MQGVNSMTPNYILLLYSALSSFLCSLLKQLFDAQYYPRNLYVFLIDVLLSTASGIVFGLILTEYVKNDLAIIGLSGLGGMFGESALKALMKIKLGKKIKIQIGFEDDSGVIVKQENYSCTQNPAKNNHYVCSRDEKPNRK